MSFCVQRTKQPQTPIPNQCLDHAWAPRFSLLQLQKFPEAPLATQRRGWKSLPKDGASSESLAGANEEAAREEALWPGQGQLGLTLLVSSLSWRKINP